jgi:lipopolysaccharide biosynthesis glycosyltransferase
LISDGDYQSIERVAHIAFCAGFTEQALALYTLLCDQGKAGSLTRLREAESNLRLGRPRLALELLDALETSGPDPSGWTQAIRAEALIVLNDPQAAATAAEKAIARAPHQVMFVRKWLRARAQLGSEWPADKLEKFALALPEEHKFEMRLWAAFAKGEYEKLAQAYRTRPGENIHCDETICRALDSLRRREDFAALGRLAQALRGAPVKNPMVATSLISAFLALEDWEAAEAVLSVVDPSDHPDLLPKKLDLYCRTRRVGQASDLLERFGAQLRSRPGALPLIVALYAEMRQWDSVLKLFRERSLAELAALVAHRNLQIVARAARERSALGELLTEVDSHLSSKDGPPLAEFRDRIAEEIVVLRIAAPPGPAVGADLTLRGVLRAERAALLADLLRERPPSVGPRRLFLCTDARFLTGAVVATASALSNNPGLDCEVEVYVTANTLELAVRVFGSLSRAFGRRIAVLNSAELVGGRKLRADYGHFCAGDQMPDTAYHRIFVTRRLVAGDIKGRLLYVDSDVVFGPGLAELFDLDLQGQPLAARGERPDAAVRRAARRLAIDPSRYFNSGVLLFDLAHPDLPQALDRTIEIAESGQERLTMQDQCALNWGFADRHRELPEKFNFFLRERDALADSVALASGPVILHYLDRPKPWDPQHGADHSARWFTEFAKLSGAVSPEDLRQLVSLQFT